MSRYFGMQRDQVENTDRHITQQSSAATQVMKIIRPRCGHAHMLRMFRFSLREAIRDGRAICDIQASNKCQCSMKWATARSRACWDHQSQLPCFAGSWFDAKENVAEVAACSS